MAGLNPGQPLLAVSGQQWPGVVYGCTTRAGGVSTGPWGTLNLAMHVGDEPQAVLENRRRLARGLPREPFWLDQVHGTAVVEVVDTGYIPLGVAQAGEGGASTLCTDATVPRADAAVTTQAGVVLAIMTADCLPVVIADIDGRALGVAHAGWRGLAAGVLEATLGALRASLPDARGWRVWIGPAISQSCFEVGEDVRSAFVDTLPATAACFLAGKQPGKWYADLAGLACHHLETMGVYAIELSGLCTYTRRDLFHSYRRSATTGRMVTVAWLQSEQAPDLP